MAIERLPERKKWVFLSREGSAVAPSGNTVILTYTPDKQAKLVEVMLEAPRAARFLVNIGGSTQKRYRLAAAGMILDARTFEDPILWWSANQALEIRTAPGASGAAGEVFSASINVWKMQP